MKQKQSNYFTVFAFIACIAFTAFTLSQYAKWIQHLLKVNYDWRFELSMVVGMLLFQFPFIFRKTWMEKWNYYFNMVIVSFKGALMLWPLLIVNHFQPCVDWINLAYFFTVVMIMFFDHKKRVVQLKMPIYISYTWVLYRFIILLFII
jgi:hypothetical protein